MSDDLLKFLKEKGVDIESSPETIGQRVRELRHQSHGEAFQEVRTQLDQSKEEVFSQRKDEALKEAIRAHLRLMEAKGKALAKGHTKEGEGLAKGLAKRDAPKAQGPKRLVGGGEPEEPPTTGEEEEEPPVEDGGGEEVFPEVPEEEAQEPQEEAPVLGGSASSEAEEESDVFVGGGGSTEEAGTEEGGGVAAFPALAQFSSEFAEQMLLAYEEGKRPLTMGQPLNLLLPHDFKVQVSIPFEVKGLSSAELSDRKLIELNLPPEVMGNRLVRAKQLERWLNHQVAFTIRDLTSKHPGKSPDEIALLLGLPPQVEVNNWINLAVYFLFWELKRDKKDLFDPSKLEDLILSEIRRFYDSYERAKSAPESIVVLEKTILCTFKMPPALLGRAFSFKELERRQTHAKNPCVSLRQKDKKTPLEEPLRRAEAGINAKIEARAKEFERQYAGKKPSHLGPDFQNYNWEELATYVILRGKDLTS